MELRPGYKKTDIGVIPEYWDVCEIGNVAEVSAGTTPSRSLNERYYRDGYIPWFKTMDLNNGLVISPSECVTKLAIEESSLRIFPAGTVLVAMYGGFQQIGRTGLLGVPAAVNQAISAIRLNGRLSPEYLLAVLNYRVSYWRDVAISSRKDANITGQDVRRFPLAYPPLPEQKAIAAALADVDASVAALSRLIAKKRDLRQGAMQRLLTGQTRLPGFTAPWQEKRLGELGRFLKGSGVRRDEAQSGDLPCVRYGEIYTTHQNVVRNFASHISRAVARTATRIQRGDILFAASGETKEEIGKCVALAMDVEAYAGGDIIILRLNSGAPVFFGYLLNTPSVVRQKANKGQGDAVVHIGASALAAIEISLPDDDEQDAIAGVLSDIDAEISTLEARLDKTRALKQAMMQALLTGRVRLPVRRDAAPQTKEAAHV